MWPSLIGPKLEKEDSPICPFSLSQGLNVMMTFFVSFFQRYSNGFRRYDKEVRFFNSHEKKTFSENSLKYEESILWTKGEILGKGAYGTVSETGSLLKLKKTHSSSTPPSFLIFLFALLTPYTLLLRDLSVGSNRKPNPNQLEEKMSTVLCN